jgi:AcrR family transcriptional regulator
VARTLDAEAHALRRDEFVDSAQRLIQGKGYEQLSIQDVLGELGASKGAFYHYFGSKSDLLEAVVERMVDAATATLTPLLTDPNLMAIEKLEGVFTGIARWKGERTDLVLAVLQVWLADDNAIVREKLRQGIVLRIAPLLAGIVEQGQAEGRFRTGEPDHVARVVVSLMQGANESAVELYFARQADTITFGAVERRFAAYREALERILGIPDGSLTIIDRPTLHQWYG